MPPEAAAGEGAAEISYQGKKRVVEVPVEVEERACAAGRGADCRWRSA